MVKRLKIIVCIVGLLLNGFPLPQAHALPQGEEVVSGSASFDRHDNTLDITTSDRVIINYDSFGIACPETVNFFQPSSASVALNRVVGTEPSAIFGALNANGQIFIINPNGILFSPTSQVNVGGLVASTLNIANQDFLNGEYRFYHEAGRNLSSVINEGSIVASPGGSVSLLGGAVENKGLIVANLGSVNLVSGEAITLNLDEEGLILAVVDEGVKEEIYDANNIKIDTGVENLGTISAEGGQVLITAEAVQDVFDTLINQEGIIEANSILEHDGAIRLVSSSEGIVQNTGTLDVSAIEVGADGGTIEMTGFKVGQFGAVHADAIDGDGGNINLWASDVVALSSDSLTTANAGLNGDGGEIIVLGEDTAVIRPNAVIAARGGSVSGDGGFIETSGLEVFAIGAVPDVSAINGKGGIWLIDPNNIVIQANGAAHANMNVAGDPWFTTADTAIVDVGLLQTALQGGSVELETRTAGLDAEDGDITLAAVGLDFNGVSGNTLTLDASNDIIIDGTIDDSSPDGDSLNLLFEAGHNVTINAAINTGGGSFVATGTTEFQSDATIEAGNITISMTGTLDNNATITATAGDITITADTVEIGANIDAGSGNLTLQPDEADRTIGLGPSVSGLFDLSGPELDKLKSSGTITLGKTGNTHAVAIGDYTFEQGNITIHGGSMALVHLNIGANTLTLNSTGAITDALGTSDTNITAATLTISAADSVGGSGVDEELDTDVDSMSIATDPGPIYILENDAVTLTSISTTTGAIDIDASGNITVTANGGVAASGNGDIDINSSGGDILTTAASDNTADISTEGGTINLTANNISDNAAPGALDIDSSTGAVTLTGNAAGGDIEVDYVSNAADAVTLTVTHNGAGDVTYDSLSTGTLSVAASTLADGNLEIRNAKAISVAGQLDTSANDGNIIIEASPQGDITLTDIDNLLNAGAGDVTLTATVQGGDIVISGTTGNDEITTTGTVTLSAETIGTTDNQLELNGATALVINDLIGLGENIWINETTQSSIAATTITVATAACGDINIDYFGDNVVDIDEGHNLNNVDLSHDTTSSFTYTATAGDITVTTIDTGDSSGGVTLTADDGSILATGADDIADITGTGLTVTDCDSFGTLASPLDLNTTTSNITSSGAVYLDVVGSGGHATTVDGAGDIVIDGRNTAGDGGYEAITLTNVDTDDGIINVYNYGHDIIATLVDNADTDKNVRLETISTGNIQVDQIISHAAADVVLDSADAVTSVDAADDTAEVTASLLTVEACDSFGTLASPLDLNTTTSNITSSGAVYLDVVGSGGHSTTIDSAAGNIEIDGRNTANNGGYEAITLANVDTDDGSITVNNYDHNIVATLVDAGGTGKNVSLTTSGTDRDIIVSGNITAADDTVTLSASGDITDITDGTSDISADTLTISAADSVGASGTNNELDTDVATLNVTSTGDVYILEDDAVTLSNVASSSGLIDIEAGGDITLNTVTAGTSATLVSTGGSIYDASLLSASATSYLKALGGVIGTKDNPVDVNINGGDLWVYASGSRDTISVNVAGTVSPSNLLRIGTPPIPPGLVLFNNRLLGGGNIIALQSRALGEIHLSGVDTVSLYYDKNLRPWEYRTLLPWELGMDYNIIDNRFLLGPGALIDTSTIE